MFNTCLDICKFMQNGLNSLLCAWLLAPEAVGHVCVCYLDENYSK